MTSVVTTPTNGAPPAEVRLERPREDALVAHASGAWKLGRPSPSAAQVIEDLDAYPTRRVELDGSQVTDWDTTLLLWVAGIARACREREIELERSHLPAGIARLIRLSEAEPEQIGVGPTESPPWMQRVGILAVRRWKGFLSALAFVGDSVSSIGRFVTFRANYRARDLWLLIQDAGVQALPIVTLVGFIVGLIVAFVGSVQLRLFGADAYVANLVAIAMTREMGAMVVGIVMAGRTGAAFAAQLGTMKVTEEIDALKTFGISAVDFLVLPRIVALVVMTPFLVLYAVLTGMIGGAFVGIGMLDVTPGLYLHQTLSAISLTDIWGGLFRGSVYGVLIAVVGCLRGMQCGNDAASVGRATTSAVVTTLVLIVIADGVLAVLFNVLGI